MKNSLFRIAFLPCVGLLLHACAIGFDSLEPPAPDSLDRASSDSAGTQRSGAVGASVSGASAPGANLAEVSKKGIYARVTVNGEPITNYDVRNRLRLLQLRGLEESDSEAVKELVEQSLQLQQARQMGVIASDAQVEEAFARFAESNQAAPDEMERRLGESGLDPQHMKEYIRAQFSWPRVLQRALPAPSTRTEDEIMRELRAAGAEKPQTSEYQLQQVVFVIPAARRAALLQSRRNEARRFRREFRGCDDSMEQVSAFMDATIRSVPRVMEIELPERWRNLVANAPEGGLTDIVETEMGVEMMAICSRRMTDDDRVAQMVMSDSGERNEGNQEAVEEYLEGLRSKASIAYR